jgi:hypothetical protein
MTSRTPSLIFPEVVSDANSEISRSSRNMPSGDFVKFNLEPSISIAIAIALFGEAPRNGAADAARVRLLIGTGLARASRSSVEVLALPTMRAGSALPLGATYPRRARTVRPGFSILT